MNALAVIKCFTHLSVVELVILFLRSIVDTYFGVGQVEQVDAGGEVRVR